MYLYLVLLSPGTGITLFVSISCDITACLSFFFPVVLKALQQNRLHSTYLSPARSAGKGFFSQCLARLNEVGKVGT